MKVYLDDLSSDTVPSRPVPSWADLHVKTYEEAIAALKTGHVTHFSFDNDLGEGLKEGRHVAAFIEEAAFEGWLKPFTWAIHSKNPVGRDDIRRAMENADRFWKEKKLLSPSDDP